jgi:hypothetical protein
VGRKWEGEGKKKGGSFSFGVTRKLAHGGGIAIL